MTQSTFPSLVQEKISAKDSTFLPISNKPLKWQKVKSPSDENILTSGQLKFKTFESYSEEWVKFVYDNRENFSDTPIHNYDIIYGPIANDKVGAQIRNFKNGSIDQDELMRRIKYLKGITFQYYFGTEAAIKTLKKL